MPRTTWTEKATQEGEYGLWRLLVRNPAFLKDLESLQRLRPVPQNWPPEKRNKALLKKYGKIEQIGDKWNLSRIPPMALLRCYGGTDPHSLESYYFSQRDGQGPFPIAFPPATWVELKADRFLYGWVDTSWPIDRVLAALETELRNFYRSRRTIQKRGRPEKLDFQFDVFDLVRGTPNAKPLNFVETSRKLGKHVSTVREAYASICRKIGIAGTAIPKDKLPTSPGVIAECSDRRCREARTEDDFCEAHRRWINVDQVSLRESFIPNLYS